MKYNKKVPLSGSFKPFSIISLRNKKEIYTEIGEFLQNIKIEIISQNQEHSFSEDNTVNAKKVTE